MSPKRSLAITVLIVFLSATCSFAFDLPIPGFGKDKKEEKANSAPPKKPEEALADALKQIDMAKNLKKKSLALRKKMDKALSEAITSNIFVIAAVDFQSQSIKCASSAQNSKKHFYDMISTLQEAKFDTASTMSDKAKLSREIVASSTEELENLTKSKLDAKDMTKGHIDGILYAFESAAVLYDINKKSADTAKKNIDDSIKIFKSQGKDVALESVKMVAALALQGKALKEQIQELSKNPFKAGELVPKLKQVGEDITQLTKVLSAYKDDYDFIDAKSTEIVPIGTATLKNIKKGRDYTGKTIKSLAKMGTTRKNLHADLMKESAKPIEKGLNILTASMASIDDRVD
ncbi:MAG: hypothetical protein EPN22_01525 [Nitrospirae bacterium]|nr:MAG: hypothetical protein EPN22_01525 [Nitrospirota bacterium]